MVTRTFLIGVLLLTFAFSFNAFAAIPPTIGYQGRLTTSSGTPVSNGNYLIKFAIYGAATGGTALWSCDYQTVAVVDGLFDVRLGATPMPPLPNNLFSNDTVRYLEIKVGTDPEIVPRTAFTSAPYAYQSLGADSAQHAEKADSATFATSASHADSADFAGHSGFADHSLNADTAAYIDTSGFSAYIDLKSESRVGPGSNQVAEGNHTHFVSGVRYIQESSFSEANLTPAMGQVTLDSLLIPGGEISGWMRITVSCWMNNGTSEVHLWVNDTDLGARIGPGILYREIKRWTTDPTWYMWLVDPIGGYAYSLTLDTSQPIVIRLTGATTTGNAVVGAGNLLIEYVQ